MWRKWDIAQISRADETSRAESNVAPHEMARHMGYVAHVHRCRAEGRKKKSREYGIASFNLTISLTFHAMPNEIRQDYYDNIGCDSQFIIGTKKLLSPPETGS